ncbi:MAG: YjgN family protein [Pseudohongiellaceae bacterium]|nr:YjgN family protein [Pseudohongiellaceae bacterium]
MTTDLPNNSTDVNHSPTPVYRFEFTGNASEYFGIWIVNILLSIITLGIYSAWAKVRTNQYFYGHTSINGHSFRYLAKPMQILIGRIIAVILFIAYTILTATMPLVGSVATLALMLISPLLIVMSLRFNLRMTSYRNVRFSFDGSFGSSFLHFVIYPLLAILTLGLAAPLVVQQIDKFINGNVRYGDREFYVETKAVVYYWIVFVTGVSAIIIFAALFAGLVPALESLGEPGPITSLAILLATVIYYSIFIGVYSAMVRNHLYNSTSVEGLGELYSDVSIIGYCWLFISNSVVTIVTLGLAYPWAKVRKAKFLARATEASISPDIEKVIDTYEAKTSAFGEEAAGIFDVDVALG